MVKPHKTNSVFSPERLKLLLDAKLSTDTQNKETLLGVLAGCISSKLQDYIYAAVVRRSGGQETNS